jgi:diphthamide biosynthesis methyltransferase
MQEYKVVMVFKNSENKNHTMQFVDIRPDVTQAEANAAMDTILASNVFRPGGFNLVAKVDCKKLDITETDFYDVP